MRSVQIEYTAPDYLPNFGPGKEMSVIVVEGGGFHGVGRENAENRGRSARVGGCGTSVLRAVRVLIKYTVPEYKNRVYCTRLYV